MAYCSGCGSRYQEGDKVCKSCGLELEYDIDPNPKGKVNPVAIKKERTNKMTKKKPTRKKKTNPILNPELTGKVPENILSEAAPSQPEETISPETLAQRQLQSKIISPSSASLNDIHLGKGIIKPKAVEVGLDGFHFKYEEPMHSAKKEDSFTIDRKTELRVLNPDFDKEPVYSAPVLPPNESSNIAKPELSVPELEKPTDPTPTIPDPVKTLEPLGKPEAIDGENPETIFNNSIEAEIRDLLNFMEESEMKEITELAKMEVEATPDRLEIKESISQNVAQPEFEIKTESNQEVVIELGTSTPTTPQATEPVKPEARPETVENVLNAAAESTPAANPDGVLEPRSKEPEIPATSAEAPEQETGSVVNLQVEPQPPLPKSRPAVIMWEGQQSWFGIPLPARICLSDQSLTITEPNGQEVKIELHKIKQITVKQSWLTKLLGIGDVIIDLRHQVPSRQILTGVANPVKLRMILEDLLQKGV